MQKNKIMYYRSSYQQINTYPEEPSLFGVKIPQGWKGSEKNVWIWYIGDGLF